MLHELHDDLDVTTAGADVATDPARIVWAQPESKLWVATNGGDYVGMVEFGAGHFTSFDQVGGVIGTSSSLPIAREMVTSAFGNDHRSPLDVPDSPEALVALSMVRPEQGDRTGSHSAEAAPASR